MTGAQTRIKQMPGKSKNDGTGDDPILGPRQAYGTDTWKDGRDFQ